MPQINDGLNGPNFYKAGPTSETCGEALSANLKIYFFNAKITFSYCFAAGGFLMEIRFFSVKL